MKLDVALKDETWSCNFILNFSWWYKSIVHVCD